MSDRKNLQNRVLSVRYFEKSVFALLFFASHATISIFKVKPVSFLSDSVSCGVVASGFTYSSHTHLAEPSVGFHMDGNQTVPPSRTCHSAAERNLCSLWVRYTGASTSEELQSWT